MRFRLLDAATKWLLHQLDALIEVLHTEQELFGEFYDSETF